MMHFNLLPKKYQNHLRDEISARILYTISLFVVVWMVVFGISVFASFQFLATQNRVIKENISGMQAIKEIAEAEEFEEKIIELNRLLLKVEEIKKGEGYDESFLLESIAPMVPPGSNLEKFTYSAASRRIILEGHANQRTQVITLQNRLEDSSLFIEVQAPLSNLLKAEDINFSFTLIVAPKEE